MVGLGGLRFMLDRLKAGLGFSSGWFRDIQVWHLALEIFGGGLRIYLGLVQGVFSLTDRNSEEAVKQRNREPKNRKAGKQRKQKPQKPESREAERRRSREGGKGRSAEKQRAELERQK